MLRKLESSREEAFSKGFELISVPLIFGHPKSWTFSVPLIFGHPRPKINGSRKLMGMRYTYLNSAKREDSGYINR